MRGNDRSVYSGIFQLLDESAEAGRRARVHGKSAVRHLRSAASKIGSGKTHRTAITGRPGQRSRRADDGAAVSGFSTDERHGYAVTEDFRVQRVVGYSCAPMTPGQWWCPAIGRSLPTEKLYEDFEDASDRAVAAAHANLCTAENLFRTAGTLVD